MKTGKSREGDTAVDKAAKNDTLVINDNARKIVVKPALDA